MALIRRVALINSSGTVQQNDGPGWGCTRTGVGTYAVTFPGTLVVAGPSLCILICPTGGTAPLWSRYSSNTTTGTTVGIFNRNGDLVDSNFSIEMCADFI